MGNGASSGPGSSSLRSPEPQGVSAHTGDDPSRVTCSFCGNDSKKAFRVVAGPGAFICDECILVAAEIVKAEHRADGRSVSCPSCGEHISMLAAVGRDQRWGMTISPGPSGLLQAATIAGAIDGAQRLMRLSCREDGANVQTYIEGLETASDGTVSIKFASLATSKKWAEANGRDSDGSPEGGDAKQGSVGDDSAGPKGHRP